MITQQYAASLYRWYLHNVGKIYVDTADDGTHIISIDINKEELKKLCEDTLQQLKLQQLKEGGLPV